MKRLIFILALAVLVCSGCRKEADYHPYIGETGDLAYDSYASQFDYLWKCMSTGYVFWDVDETDWDAIYVEYMPKFQALDEKHEAFEDFKESREFNSEDRRLTAGGVGGLGLSYTIPYAGGRKGGHVITLDALYYYDFVSHHKGYPHLSDPRYLSILSITMGLAFNF